MILPPALQYLSDKQAALIAMAEIELPIYGWSRKMQEISRELWRLQREGDRWAQEGDTDRL